MSVSLDIQRDAGSARRYLLTALLVLTTAVALRGSLVAQEPEVSSFAAAQDGSAPAAGDPAQAEPVLSFTFRFAPWETVLVKFADVAGLTLDLTEVPPGTFNYHDKGRYSPREALDVLNGYLLQRGFVLVRRDRFLVCVNLAKGIPANLIPTVTVDALPNFGKNELVSVILTHQDMDANLAVSQIEQLQGPHGTVVSLNAANSLLVMDTGSNVRLINGLLERGAFTHRPADVAGSGFKSFTLQHARAADAERLIRTLFGLPATPPSAEAATGSPGTADVSITTDARMNRLFVTATRAKLATIEQMIADYDVADATTDGAPRIGSTTTRIVPLPHADVIVIGRALQSLSPRIRVSTTRSARVANSADSAPARDAADQPGDAPAAKTPARVEAPQSPNGRDR